MFSRTRFPVLNELFITVNHSNLINLEQISSFWKWRSTTLPCLKSSWSQPGRCAGASVHYPQWLWSLHGSSPESLSARPKREKTSVKTLFQKIEIYSTCLSISFSSCCAHIFLFQEFDTEPHSNTQYPLDAKCLHLIIMLHPRPANHAPGFSQAILQDPSGQIGHNNLHGPCINPKILKNWDLGGKCVRIWEFHICLEECGN